MAAMLAIRVMYLAFFSVQQTRISQLYQIPRVSQIAVPSETSLAGLVNPSYPRKLYLKFYSYRLKVILENWFPGKTI